MDMFANIVYFAGSNGKKDKREPGDSVPMEAEKSK